MTISYAGTGPFTNAAAPGISATFLNNVETCLSQLCTGVNNALPLTGGTISGNLTVTGTATVNSTLTASSLTVNNNAAISGAATITGVCNFTNGYLQMTNNTTFMVFNAGANNGIGFGWKRMDGTKLMELKSSGSLVVVGSYQTTSGGGTFDGFDFADCVRLMEPLPDGTVVCPVGDQTWNRCTHDNCGAASVLSTEPGHMNGMPDKDNGWHPLALAGQVKAVCTTSIPFAPGVPTYVVSDGQGGVRVAETNELAHVLGVTLEASVNGMVGILLRNQTIPAQQ